MFIGLELEIAIKILENVEDYVTINQPPIKPKGGEIFLFLPDLPNEQGMTSFLNNIKAFCLQAIYILYYLKQTFFYLLCQIITNVTNTGG